ncbi:MAG: hypothetical protein LUM44_14435 [Pyrinomonadaceae bacterium]|nr:hypothetical protein [Pyrinomonadaceae bacterium]
MKKFALDLFFGRDNRISGLIAFTIIGLIVLGCTCNKDFKLDTNSTSNSGTFANTSSSPSANTASTPKPDVEDADASTGKLPSDAQLQELARETVLDFNDAIQSEDFTAFHSKISKPFQKQASPERFKQVFAEFLNNNINFSEVDDLEAEFSPAPAVGKESGYKVLSLNGSYATTPRRTKFELKYIPEGKEWKLIFIRISTKD